jgi:hypothetical protein
MSGNKPKTKTIDKSNETLADRLNQVPVETKVNLPVKKRSTAKTKKPGKASAGGEVETKTGETKDAFAKLFDRWDEKQFEPQDFIVEVPVDSLESAVGYSSLLRQMHQSFIQMVAYYKSPAGGALSTDEARSRAFHACDNEEEAREVFQEMMQLPLENLNFVDLQSLHSFAPRVAERFWEMAKREGKAEFESGHLAANITFPTVYLKQFWNIARYLGVRESFIDDWNPQGGIEVALIDMLAQTYFQWQFWLEQTVTRSKTPERKQEPKYEQWRMQMKEKYEANGWDPGYWYRPYVSEQQAIEHAVQMADRFNRIFMRTLRQLRDLRRYSPVTINSPQQVNIAANGGQQVNIGNNDIEKPRQSKAVLKE